MPRTPVRPGIIIKQVLSGELSVVRQVLEAGSLVERSIEVSSASVSELHQVYQRQVKAARMSRVDGRRSQQTGSCYDTFRKRTWEAWKLGLIEPVNEGDPVPSGAGYLLSTRGSWPNAEVIQSRRVFYALTEQGLQEEDAWRDLTTTHKRFIEEGRVLPEVPTITLPARFSIRTVQRLAAHFEQLVDLAEQADWPEQPFPALAAEGRRLLERGIDWRDSAQDSLDSEEGRDFPSESRLETLEQRRDTLDAYVEALEEEDLSAALEALSDIE